jgi:hypothetical protein
MIEVVSDCLIQPGYVSSPHLANFNGLDAETAHGGCVVLPCFFAAPKAWEVGRHIVRE